MYICFVLHCFNLICFHQQTSSHRLLPSLSNKLSFSYAMPRTIKARNIPCAVPGCTKTFSNRGGLKNHLKVHRKPRQHIPEQHLANNNHRSPSPIPGGFQPEGEQVDTADDGASHRRGERVRYHPLINGTPISSVICCFFFILYCFCRSSM
jgi:hypothetical protein